MAEGDIKIWKMHGYLLSDTSGEIPLYPFSTTGVPTMVADDHWAVQAKVWRTMTDVIDSASGPYMKSFEHWMLVQHNGTYIHYYEGTPVVLKNATTFLGGESSDSITLVGDSGYVYLGAQAADTQEREWFAQVIIYTGVGGMTIPT
jgi:hypothetical protein